MQALEDLGHRQRPHPRRLAGPNDVLVSSTLRDLVIGSGLEFEDRGAHQLKGVPGEWRLFAVA
jgi:class 3 adenylate cyclase